MISAAKKRKPMAGCIRTIAILSAVVIVVTLRACVLRPSTSYPGSHFNHGQNAAWLGVEWVMEPHSTEEINRLAVDLDARQIRTIFIYVSYLKINAIFNPTYDHAKEFIAEIKKASPDLDVQGWLGIPIKSPADAPVSARLELTSDQVRSSIIQFSQSVVQDLGFDGVHLDVEPVGDGDQILIDLLRELRMAIGPNKHLSIAVPAKLPVVSELPSPNRVGWSAEYYRTVASQVDEIAVMAYDSAMPAGFLYQVWQRLQIVSLTQALAGTSVDVFVGVPTSEETTAAHLPWAENMQSGLQGVIDGLNDSESYPDVFSGIAIYPYWQTTDDEWQIYRELWLDSGE